MLRDGSSETVLLGKSCWRVCQTCMRCEALFCSCRSEVLSEGRKTKVLPEGRAKEMLRRCPCQQVRQGRM